MFGISPAFWGGASAPVVKIFDQFDGAGASSLTGHAPDIVPAGMVWTNTTTSMLLSGTGYTYAPGSAAVDTLAARNNLGNTTTPTTYGISDNFLLTFEITWGTSNAPQVGGFGAIGLDCNVYLNGVNFLVQVSGNASPNEWRLRIGTFGNFIAITAPSINTAYTVTLDCVGNNLVLAGFGQTRNYTSTPVDSTGLQAIQIGASSRTGGGIHYRTLTVLDRG